MIPPWLKDSVAPLLAIIVVVGGLLLVYFKDSTKTEIIALMTFVLGYYFGSSKGSQDKDAVIAKMPPIEKRECCKPDHEHKAEG